MPPVSREFPAVWAERADECASSDLPAFVYPHEGGGSSRAEEAVDRPQTESAYREEREGERRIPFARLDPRPLRLREADKLPSLSLVKAGPLTRVA